MTKLDSYMVVVFSVTIFVNIISCKTALNVAQNNNFELVSNLTNLVFYFREVQPPFCHHVTNQ